MDQTMNRYILFPIGVDTYTFVSKDKKYFPAAPQVKINCHPASPTEAFHPSLFIIRNLGEG